MRSYLALVVAFGICVSYWQAPFTHVHAAGAAEEHSAKEHAGSLAFHIHLGQGTEGATWVDLSESSRSTNWYRFEVQELVGWSVEPAPAGFVLIGPSLSAKSSVFVDYQDRLHDPPEARPAAPRAPPSC